MRKTLNEKIEIVKQAKSKKLIKKLSVLHGITTKTINSWVASFKAGNLNGKKSARLELGLKNKTGPASFFEAVFKVTSVYTVSIAYF